MATTACACAGIITCFVAVLMMGHRGFDYTDEGFYLLSYRWWQFDPRNFTGAQYIYGPVFELLGYSVSTLRLFRFIILVACHAVFGWQLLGWLSVRSARVVAKWQIAATAAITATGCVSIGWLPLSPGYNDLALLGALLLAAFYLHLERTVEVGGAPSIFFALGLGPLAFVLVLAKWTSGILLLAFLAAFILTSAEHLRIVVRPRFIVTACLGTVATLMGFDLLVAPLGDTLRNLLAVNRLVAQDTNSPLALMEMYLTTGADLLERCLSFLLEFAALAVLGALLTRLGWRRIGAVVASLGPVLSTVAFAPKTGGLLIGGVQNLGNYAAALLGFLFGSGAVVLVSRLWNSRSLTGGSSRSSARVWLLLAVLPLVQGFGTGNPLYAMAINAFALWFALIIAAIAMGGLDAVALVLVSSAGVCACVSAVSVGATGVLLHPYRTSSYAASTEPIGGPGPVAGMLVDRDTAAGYASVRRALGGLDTRGRFVMAFDEMSGIVLALDGRPVGEPWYSGVDHGRTAVGIETACQSGAPWARQPILIFDRRPTSVDRRALSDCGLGLARDFRRIRTRVGARRVIIYVPTEA